MHTAVERRVTELAGSAGAKLHTGRSRNDQVATDLRLWTKRELVAVARLVTGLQGVLLDPGPVGPRQGVYLPGYTHLQRAQPVLLAHHLLAHGWALAHDVDRLLDARRRVDVSPLGAGALAGSSLPLDPVGTAHASGSRHLRDSLDAVGDRDFVAESLFSLALLGVHCPGSARRSCSGRARSSASSAWPTSGPPAARCCPRRRTPTWPSWPGARRAGIGNLVAVLTALKGLPLAYNRDLQEDKEPRSTTVDQVGLALIALTGLLDTARFEHARRMAAGADSPESAAVDLAEWLVVRGIAFRAAHGIVAELVRESLDRHVPLADLVAASPHLGADAVALLEPGVAVTRRTTPGGAGPGPVAEQLRRFRSRLEVDGERLARG